MQDAGKWQVDVCTGLSIDQFSREKLDATAAELVEEKEVAYSCISEWVMTHKAKQPGFDFAYNWAPLLGGLSD